jgi:uncharacterized membrane protein
MQDWEVYAGAAVIGSLAGIRSMSAPAIVGTLSRKNVLADVGGALAVVSKPRFAPTMSLLAFGELVADKLPIVPNRTSVGPLVGRALTGGVSGAVICASKRQSAWLGALIGASAAIGAAYGAYHLRKRVSKGLHVPDAVVALAEDALVGVVGAQLVSRLSESADAAA